MLRGLPQILGFCLLVHGRESRLYAAAWSLESSFGQSYTAQLTGLEPLAASQREYSLSLVYRSPLPSSWLFHSRPAWGLHLALTQNSYAARRVQNIGNGYYLGLTGEWRWPTLWERGLCQNQQRWIVRFRPELILSSRIITGSFSEADSPTGSLASASLSQWDGNGGWALHLGLSRRLSPTWWTRGFELGASWKLSTQYFQSKTDLIAARVPSTGAVLRLKESSQGSYQLLLQALSFDVSTKI